MDRDFEIFPVSEDSSEWQCSVLKLGGATVLLNCGWTEAMDPALLSPLLPFLQDLDLILITHADMKHLGALPYLLSKYPVVCPVVCTEPTCRIGELSCVASLEDRKLQKDFDVDDILRVFTRLTPLKYCEKHTVAVGGTVLTACPFQAGGHLGSAYWTIYCGDISVVYLVDYDLRRGRYLDGLEVRHLLPSSRSRRWNVLITSLPPAVSIQLPRHGAQRAPQSKAAHATAQNVAEEVLLEETIGALRKGGSVLMPVDACRAPELLLLLEAAWAQDRQLVANYPLVWLSSVGDMVLDQVKTRLEYMSQEVLSNFETRFGQNPFVLRNVRIYQTLEELCAAHPLSQPKVILSTSAHLECGDSRELFMRLCSEPRTLVWLLGVPPSGTLARQLLEDFVLKHASRKEYRLQHYVPDVHGVPDVPDAEVPELEPEVQKDDLFEKSQELSNDWDPELGKLPKEVGKCLEPLEVKESTWPASRPQNEGRCEGDEYGHLLSVAEMKAWRSQDQEGNKYSSPSVEEPLEAVEEVPEQDWRDAIRLQVREPVRYEVRNRTVRVACRVRFSPHGAELKDTYSLVRLIAPNHVALLSTSSSAVKHLQHSSLTDFRQGSAPEIHAVGSLSFPLTNRKRKIHFGPDVWQKISFLKTAHEMRVAQVHTCPLAPREGSDPRVVEMCAPVANGTNGKDTDSDERLPRAGAMFLDLSEENGLSLSSLKAQLQEKEAGKRIEFTMGSPFSVRPWSARVLRGDKTVLGWRRESTVLRVEGVPGEQFFQARDALYRRCALV